MKMNEIVLKRHKNPAQYKIWWIWLYFAYDYKGHTISHGDHSLVGKNRLDVVTNRHYIIKDIVEGGKRNPEVFMTYVASYHPTAQDRSKISFIRPIPQFEWVIGTGAYLFEENNAPAWTRADVKKQNAINHHQYACSFPYYHAFGNEFIMFLSRQNCALFYPVMKTICWVTNKFVSQSNYWNLVSKIRRWYLAPKRRHFWRL